MTRTRRKALQGANQIGATEDPQALQPEPELWQEVRQTSPEMAIQARVIRVLRPSVDEPRDSYPTTSP